MSLPYSKNKSMKPPLWVCLQSHSWILLMKLVEAACRYMGMVMRGNPALWNPPPQVKAVCVCRERKWMGVSLGRTFLSQWGRGGGGSSRVGMLPAHYWTEMLQLGGAMQNRQLLSHYFLSGPRKPQGVLATAQIIINLNEPSSQKNKNFFIKQIHSTLVFILLKFW